MAEVIWLPQAENDLDEILRYLQQKWGERVLEEFIVKLERIIKLICEQQTMFCDSSKMNIL